MYVHHILTIIHRHTKNSRMWIVSVVFFYYARYYFFLLKFTSFLNNYFFAIQKLFSGPGSSLCSFLLFKNSHVPRRPIIGSFPVLLIFGHKYLDGSATKEIIYSQKNCPHNQRFSDLSTYTNGDNAMWTVENK